MRRSVRPAIDGLEDRALLATGPATHLAQFHARFAAHVVNIPVHHPFRLNPPIVTPPHAPKVPSAPLIPTPTPPPVQSPTPLGGITLTLTTDKTSYKVGERVAITLKETNTSDKAITTEYGPSILSYSASKNGARVWNSSIGVFEPMFIELFTLQPGESRTYSAVWNDEPSLDPVSGGAQGTPVTGTIQVGAQLGGVNVAPVTIKIGG